MPDDQTDQPSGPRYRDTLSHADLTLAQNFRNYAKVFQLITYDIQLHMSVDVSRP